jgi:hypothetical protein
MVLIRHECGEGSHWDWMLAPAHCPTDPDARVLDSWRVSVPLHRSPPSDPIEVEMGPMHRVAYLALAAPRALAGDRGHVTPVASGRWREVESSIWEVAWDGHWTGTVSLSASPRGPSWRLMTAFPNRDP